MDFLHGCIGLTGSIPENLFKNCTEVTDFSHTFAGCRGLTGQIPEDLFNNCTKVNKFNGTFSSCTGISGAIPNNLFINCNQASQFSETFISDTRLTGTAPALWERDNVTNSKNCFHGCTNLSNYNEIPSSWGGGGA